MGLSRVGKARPRGASRRLHLEDVVVLEAEVLTSAEVLKSPEDLQRALTLTNAPGWPGTPLRALDHPRRRQALWPSALGGSINGSER